MISDLRDQQRLSALAGFPAISIEIVRTVSFGPFSDKNLKKNGNILSNFYNNDKQIDASKI